MEVLTYFNGFRLFPCVMIAANRSLFIFILRGRFFCQKFWDLPKNFQSEKIAVFVADGVCYTLTGRVSAATMAQIVDSMEY